MMSKRPVTTDAEFTNGSSAMRCAISRAPAAPLGVDADNGRDQLRPFGQVEQADDLDEVAVEQVAQP